MWILGLKGLMILHCFLTLVGDHLMHSLIFIFAVCTMLLGIHEEL